MGVVKAFIAVSRDGVIATPEQAARAQADSGATTTGFEVDRDRIPSVVAELRRAVDALLLAEREAGEAGFLAPPGDDPVSDRAAGEMGARLVEKYLSLNHRARDNLESMIANLLAAMAQYDAEEDEAVRSFDR